LAEEKIFLLRSVHLGMNASMHILLAEDEPKIAKSVADQLIESGFTVDIAFDGKVAEKMFMQHAYGLVILDINLPYKNGLELCAIFRKKNSGIPIIMLTALGEIQDKLDAFEFGADDYLVKPFHFRELLARIKVFIKRTDVNEFFDEVLQVADLEIDMAHKTVTRQGKSIQLSPREFSLLELLVRARGRVVSKTEIAEKVWDVNFDTGTNTIEVYINFLRNKVDKPFERKLIHTKPGFGYYLKEE
jgi:two-component system copper resistance phosphate regulon response regulator CusR